MNEEVYSWLFCSFNKLINYSNKLKNKYQFVLVMPVNPYPFKGLSEAEVEASRQENGNNATQQSGNNAWWEALKDTVLEPMFLLLVACTIIYFLLHELSEGFFMLGAIVLVSAISFYQDSRSKKALEALKAFTQTSVTAIRNNEVTELLSEEIVVGDVVVVSEGEATITGEVVLFKPVAGDHS